MSLIKDTKLGIKLSLAFFVVVAVFVAVAAYQIRTLDRLAELQEDSASRAVDAEDVLNIVNRIESLTIICSDAIIGRNFNDFKAKYADFKTKAERDSIQLNVMVDTDEERKNAETVGNALKAYVDTIDKKLIPYLESGSKDMDEVRYIYARIIAFRDAMRKPLEQIARSIEDESHEAAGAFDAARKAAITTGMAVTAAGVFLAVIVAAVMTLSIVRPLKKATAFALDLAAGMVDKDLPIRQRDEVGEVCWSLRRIAEALRNMLGEFAAATGDISLGRLRSRGDASTFKGAYADLIGNANHMADTLVNYLDMVPSPITTLDNEHAILFINKAGAQAGGADPRQLQGTKCYDHFRTDDCNTPGCACSRAMEIRGPASSETTARPGGSELEIVYSAVPITDSAGKVVGAFEMVTDQTEIKRAQKQMNRLADQAQGIASNLSSAAEELSAQVEESSRGSEIQRDRAAETATAMEEMNSTVMAVAHSASNAAKAADATQAKAREGARNVETLVAAVLDIKAQMDALSANMAGLGQQAEGISRVLNVISDIADQTNLLALNAAIEAARAGDAGRGFAVVADEVRKLAEKTMTATKEVGDAITAIQDGARKSIDETQKAAESVAGSAATAQASGAALNEIVVLAEETADQVRSIAAASEQQSASSEQINRSTEEINRISTETAETMGQSAEAVVELARLAQQLGALIQEMNA